MRRCCDASQKHTEDNRSRMWIFILFYILGLSVSQATGQVISTKMYYAKLTIDESAIENITAEMMLEGFANMQVEELKMTTVCRNISDEPECTCEPHYRWSDELCQSDKKCCGNSKCTFAKLSSPMCISNTTVIITGSLVLTGEEYYNCLAEENSEKFQRCNDKLLEKLTAVYSTLWAFDNLRISKYRVGSVIADFEATFARKVKEQDLIRKAEDLTRNLSGSLILETRGIVHLSMPPNPVCYNSRHNLRCTVQEDLMTLPEWKLKRENQTFDITSGTESRVTSIAKESDVTITNIADFWAGEYTCVYHQRREKFSISHKASAVMTVSLLPNIHIMTVPGFPLCEKSSDLLKVRVECEIKNSTEHYDVTWSGQDLTGKIAEQNMNRSNGADIYSATVIVSCNPNQPTPQMMCTFKNRCNQTRTASTYINIIYENDLYCAAEGEWGNAKAGFTAVLKCKNEVGLRQRKCYQGSNNGTWKSEVSRCVNLKVNDVLEKANTADSGLGDLNGNAEHVFSTFESITNNSETINTFANMNASVQVLVFLSQKQNLKPSGRTVNDFLASSSNLLEKSLNQSWEQNDDTGNFSLAEKYLSSVEHLIHMANTEGVTKEKNIEVATRDCSRGSECTNSVFNATVFLNSPGSGNVKVAGFKQLESYLPNNNSKLKPNSIVVSATTENTPSDSVEVKLNFQLLEPRPRHVEMHCMSWDNKTRSWSSFGCKWDGASNEGHCVCTHLSSFAILMSKHPLEVPGIIGITYAGLSVSVISLIINLVIELMVWNSVVKTNTLYLRHTAHVNISLCLLVADCCFLASLQAPDISIVWCKTFTILKHFCYLSMFFWMLSLSSTLLHQTVFLFHNVSKKNYLKFSIVLGYGCPLLIVAITFITNNAGAEGVYFTRETCWLVYTGLMKGSIHTFVIPVGIISFINVFSMLVVIMKLLDHPKYAEASYEKEKKAAVTVMRSVILLTPVFGVTWIIGFAVLLLDLTSGAFALVANYAFTVVNAFQGLLILLTTCLGDKLTYEALLKRLKHNALQISITGGSTKLDST